MPCSAYPGDETKIKKRKESSNIGFWGHGPFKEEQQTVGAEDETNG